MHLNIKVFALHTLFDRREREGEMTVFVCKETDDSCDSVSFGIFRFFFCLLVPSPIRLSFHFDFRILFILSLL